MKEKVNGFLHTLFGERTAFKAVLLFVMIFSTIQWVHYTFSFVYRGFLVWGVLIVAWDLFHGKKLWEGKTLNLLMAFCMFYAVTIFLNRDVEPVRNLKSLAYMAVLFITLYGGGKAEPEKTKRERKILIGELFVIFLLLAVACLVLFLLGIKKTYTTADGVMGYLGSFNGRMAGLFNSNTCGALFSISVLIDLGLLFGHRGARLWRKILYWISLVLSVLCLVLSYSRTSIYALAAVLAIAVFWLLPRRIKSLETASFKTVMTARVTAALCLLLVMTEAAAPMHAALTNLEGVFAEKKTTKKKTKKKTTKKKTTKKTTTAETTEASGESSVASETEAAGKDTAGKTAAEKTTAAKKTTAADKTTAAKKTTAADKTTAAKKTTAADKTTAAETESAEKTLDSTLTGRLSIWKAALQAYREHALFGITDEGITIRVGEILDGTGWGVHLQGGGAHNVYLETLVASGTVGALCMAVFALTAVVMMAVRRKTWIGTGSPQFIVLLLLIAFFLIAEFMETRILYRMGFFMVFFWTAAGMLKEDVMGIEIVRDVKSKKRILSQTDL